MDYSFLIIFAVLMVGMWIWTSKRDKKARQQEIDRLNSLQVGDEITTKGGIIGKIISIKEETVMIETGHDRTKIRIHKWAVRNVDVKAEDAQD